MVIDCKNLRRNYRSFKKEPGFLGSLKSFISPNPINIPAVQDFSFEVKRGEVVGLLGPNGAGKTTLIKMLTGIIPPSAGALSVLGTEPFKRTRDFRRRIALVMGQKSQLGWDIPAFDSFLLLQRYYEVPDKEFKARREDTFVAWVMPARLLGVHPLS